MAADPELKASVTSLLQVTGAGASALSQHLAILKEAEIVVSTRTRNEVVYQLTEPLIAELLVVARAFLVTRLAKEQADDAIIEALHRLPAIPGATVNTVLDRVGDLT
jgi:ArsR family transcriptional regulator